MVCRLVVLVRWGGVLLFGLVLVGLFGFGLIVMFAFSADLGVYCLGCWWEILLVRLGLVCCSSGCRFGLLFGLTLVIVVVVILVSAYALLCFGCCVFGVWVGLLWCFLRVLRLDCFGGCCSLVAFRCGFALLCGRRCFVVALLRWFTFRLFVWLGLCLD